MFTIQKSEIVVVNIIIYIIYLTFGNVGEENN